MFITQKAPELGPNPGQPVAECMLGIIAGGGAGGGPGLMALGSKLSLLGVFACLL